MADKKEKKVPAKKLPGLFKKKYSEEDFKKKVLKKIYIDSDKKLVEKQFTKEKNAKGKTILLVDKTAQLSKADFIRCKAIAKDVKNQKGGIKLLPLFATIIFIAAIGITVTLFKNIVLQRAITLTMQGIFGAKTDVEKVDLQIFGASLEVDGLAQANKDSPMKNLFQIDKIHVDFNLTDLLRGKFHAENIEVSGVAIGTDREKSGEIIGNPKSKAEQLVEKEAVENSENLSNGASNRLKQMFENYNPEKMLSNVQNELKSPAVAKQISGEVQQKVEKWKNVPSEYEKSISNLTKSVNSLVKTDWGKINDPVKLKKALEDLNTTLVESDSLKDKLNSQTKSIKTDATLVSNYSSELQSAIKADSALVDSKIAEMRSLFSADGLKNIMMDAVKGMLYEKAGKFYPYINKAMDAALNSKGNVKSEPKSDSKDKKKKAKNVSHARLPGRTVYYKKDTVPKLLIENVKASGYEYKTNELLFEGSAKDISSDQNMLGKPALINADFKVLGKPNSADITIDARENTKAPLVLAKYSGKGYPLSADAQVFALKSNSDINATLTAQKDGSFVVGGTLNLNVKEMTGMKFEPAKVSDLYGKTVAGIKNLSIGFNAGFDAEKGLVIEITNMDKLASQLSTPVANALTGELNTIAKDAKNNITKVLNEKTGIATSSINQFTDISKALNGELNSVNDLQKQIKNKQAEITKQLAKTGTNAAADAAKGALKKLF